MATKKIIFCFTMLNMRTLMKRIRKICLLKTTMRYLCGARLFFRNNMADGLMSDLLFRSLLYILSLFSSWSSSSCCLATILDILLLIQWTALSNLAGWNHECFKIGHDCVTTQQLHNATIFIFASPAVIHYMRSRNYSSWFPDLQFHNKI